MTRTEEAEWIAGHVELIGPIQTVHDRPWACVARALTPAGVVWFKACSALQDFEPRLTAGLAARWPDRMPQVLAHDESRR